MKSFSIFAVIELMVVMLLIGLIGLVSLFAPKVAERLARPFERYADDIMDRMVLMAVVNTKSTTITNLDAAQVVRAPSYRNGGDLREWMETLEVANGDSAASVYRFFRVPSSLRVSELIADTDDIGTTATADLGLYRTAADGGAVVDADFFASALVWNAGALASQQVVHESAVVDLPNYGKRLWEQLGLAADPQVDYDVCATLVGAADGAGTVTLRLRGSTS